MRTIKFRAWDKECEVMVYSDKHNHKDYDCDYWFDINNENVYCMWSDDYDDICGFTETRSGELDNIMQYTGLKDKNGKEIYEGDIVDIRYAKNYKHRYLEVIYDRGAFRINDKWSQHDLGLYITEKIEVVGNIYENAELLNQD